MSGLDFHRGTIVITSQPSEDVVVWLDGQQVGTRTPLTIDDVDLGPHELTVRAEGFVEKTQRFDLAGKAPTLVNVELAAQDAHAN